MTLLNLGPIIIMLLLVGLVFILFTRGLKLKKRTSSFKKRPMFFMLYASLLIVALIISLVVPNNKLEKLEEYEGDYDGEAYFYEVMDQTKSIDEIAEFKQTEKSYPLSGDQLDFSETSNDDYYYQNLNILLVKDPSLTDEFIVETYKTPFIYNGNDISEFIHSAEIGGNDGVVHIHSPTKMAILSMYDYSFPFKQFSGDPSAFGGFSSYQIPSEELVIVYIPEYVTPNVAHIIDDSIYHVEMITKE